MGEQQYVECECGYIHNGLSVMLFGPFGHELRPMICGQCGTALRLTLCRYEVGRSYYCVEHCLEHEWQGAEDWPNECMHCGIDREVWLEQDNAALRAQLAEAQMCNQIIADLRQTLDSDKAEYNRTYRQLEKAMGDVADLTARLERAEGALRMAHERLMRHDLLYAFPEGSDCIARQKIEAALAGQAEAPSEAEVDAAFEATYPQFEPAYKHLSGQAEAKGE